MGIEPTWPAWKAGALPLSYTRTFSTDRDPRRERERPSLCWLTLFANSPIEELSRREI